MQILSVNVGRPRDVVWRGETIATGIFKDPVAGEVHVATLNLAGDQQANLVVHGGPQKAIYGYPSEHYEYWRHELPGVPLTWGNFGENLTTTGLAENALHIGDQLRVGTATLMVTQPRLPCFKLALRFDRDDIIKRFLLSRRSGFYFSVVQEGTLSATAPIEILHRDPLAVSVEDVMNLFLGVADDPQLLSRAMQLEALPENWKHEFVARAPARRAKHSA